MRTRPVFKTLALSFILFFTIIAAGYAAGKGTIIKIATLAPEGSTWVNIFNTINEEIKQKTDGQVSLRIYPGGVLGDEKDMLRKINIGQIHGAALSSPGLSALFKELDIFQVPFLFQTYGEVDYVLTHMDRFFKEGLAANGYLLLGWSEGGFVRLMTTSPATTLEELKRLKVWNWEEAPISKAIFEEAGVTGIPLSVPDVLVGLQTGLVDVVYAPPAGAIALQWFTRVKYIMDLPLLYMAGGVVVKQSVFQGLAADHQRIVQAIFDENMPNLMAAIRRDNQEALQIMAKHGVQTLKPPPDQIVVFKQLSNRALKDLPGTTFSPQILAEVNQLLEKYRAGTK